MLHNYPTHLHSFFEIEYICAGEAIAYLNGAPIHLKPGSLKFCTPLDIESIDLITPSITLININFTENFIEPELLSDIQTGFIIDNTDSKQIALLQEEYDGQQPFRLLYQKNLLNIILLDSMRINRTKQPAGVGRKRTSDNISQQVALYIHLHYREPLTLSDISNRFSYTHNHLSKLFKETFDMSVMQYLVKTRLEQAEKLLLCSNLTMTEIAGESGFSSVSTFFRVFKQHSGISPKEFQKKHRLESRKTISKTDTSVSYGRPPFYR